MLSSCSTLRRVRDHFFAAAMAIGAVLVPGIAAAQTCPIPGNDGIGASVTGVVNSYYPGSASAAAGATSISVGTINAAGSATPIAVGDLLLIVQMQGADITNADNNTYGDGIGDGTTQNSDVFGGTNYAGGFLNNTNFTAGRYEYAVATTAVTGGVVGLSVGLQNAYSNGTNQRFQVVRVPQYATLTIGAAGLSAAGWNGTSGGIVAVDVSGLLTLGPINANGRGFRAGGVRNVAAQTAPQYAGYRNLLSTENGGFKGEGIAGTPARTYSALLGLSATAATDGYPGGDVGRGAPGTAGGGGNQHNCGGGGGANGNAGGRGGACWNSNTLNADGPLRGAHGGSPAVTAATPGKLFLGGGGGAADVGGNGSTDPQGSGGAGGGIILVRAGSLAGSATFSANGDAAADTNSTDGSGGGGAGGTILVQVQSGSTAGLTLTATGGRGGNPNMGANPELDGPGGGGSGGVIYTNAGAIGTVTGGVAGQITSSSTSGDTAPQTRYYARDGGTGITSSFSAPIASAGVRAGAACLPSVTVTKATSTASIAASGVTTATYSITVQNTGGGARNVSVIDNALPPGWTLTGTPTYAYTPALPMAAGTLASGAEASSTAGGATFPLTGAAPLAAPAAGANALTWNNLFLAPVRAGVASQLTITYTASIPATAPVGCFHNPAGFSVLDATRATATRLLTAATSNGSNRAGTVYSANTTYDTGATSAVAGSNYSGLEAGGTGENVCLQGDLSVTKTGPASLAIGASGNYVITPRNNGRAIRDLTFAADQASAATNANAATRVLVNGVVRVTDTVPTGLTIVGTPAGTNWTCSVAGQVITCDYATLPLAATTDLPAITANVLATTAACPGPLSNVGVVAGLQAPYIDSNIGNNTSAAAATSLVCSADLAITKTDGIASIVSGGTVTYTINVSNPAGGAAADGARLLDPAATGLTCTAATCTATNGAQCPGGTVNGPAVPLVVSTLQAPGYVIPTLPAGGNIAVTLTCAVTATGF